MLIRILILSTFTLQTTHAQRPGIFIFGRFFWNILDIQRIILPPEVRTRILYQVPQNVLLPTILPSYRRTLEPQIFDAEITPFQTTLPTTHEIPRIEAFGIRDELRNNPQEILALAQAAHDWAIFGLITSNELSPTVTRTRNRNLAIAALGVTANLHVEAAGAMREQGYAPHFIEEQIRQAHNLMAQQLRHLQQAHADGEEVEEVYREVEQARAALNYQEPPQRPRFWEGFKRRFW